MGETIPLFSKTTPSFPIRRLIALPQWWICCADVSGKDMVLALPIEAALQKRIPHQSGANTSKADRIFHCKMGFIPLKRELTCLDRAMEEPPLVRFS
jgi:hypothetical protein